MRRQARKILLLAPLILAVAACTTVPPPPPRPAMQPLSVAGNFGFSERDIDADTVEVTYRGAEVPISTRAPRTDPRVTAEKEKVRGLALLRAARIAQERGASSLRIASENTDSDIDVRSHPRCRVAPLWSRNGFWGPGFGYGLGYRNYYGWSDDYICTETRTARARATAVLVVDLIADPKSGPLSLSALETIARLEKMYAGATYP